MINWETAPDNETVCYCCNVDKQTIVNAIRNGAASERELVSRTGAGKGVDCKKLHPDKRCCHPDLRRLLEIYGF